MKIVSERAGMAKKKHLKILHSGRAVRRLDNEPEENIENLFRLIYVYGRFMGINNLMLF